MFNLAQKKSPEEIQAELSELQQKLHALCDKYEYNFFSMFQAPDGDALVAATRADKHWLSRSFKQVADHLKL